MVGCLARRRESAEEDMGWFSEGRGGEGLELQWTGTSPEEGGEARAELVGFRVEWMGAELLVLGRGCDVCSVGRRVDQLRLSSFWSSRRRRKERQSINRKTPKP